MDWVQTTTTTSKPSLAPCRCITCDGEHSIKAAISVRQIQPVTHLDLVSLAPGKVHQGATNVAAQLEHFLVDVEILSIATTCQKEQSDSLSKSISLDCKVEKTIGDKVQCFNDVTDVDDTITAEDTHQCRRRCSQTAGLTETGALSARLCSDCR